jgi:hypothetical protein
MGAGVGAPFSNLIFGLGVYPRVFLGSSSTMGSARTASLLVVVPPREKTSGMLLGTGDLGRPVFLNPSSPPNTHGIIVDTTESGKSTLTRHLILETRDPELSS